MHLLVLATILALWALEFPKVFLHSRRSYSQSSGYITDHRTVLWKHQQTRYCSCTVVCTCYGCSRKTQVSVFRWSVHSKVRSSRPASQRAAMNGSWGTYDCKGSGLCRHKMCKHHPPSPKGRPHSRQSRIPLQRCRTVRQLAAQILLRGAALPPNSGSVARTSTLLPLPLQSYVCSIHCAASDGAPQQRRGSHTPTDVGHAAHLHLRSLHPEWPRHHLARAQAWRGVGLHELDAICYSQACIACMCTWSRGRPGHSLHGNKAALT